MAWISDKNSKSFKIDVGGYVAMPHIYKPTFKGEAQVSMYLNVDYQLKPWYIGGQYRGKLVRDEKVDDPTAFDDLFPLRKMTRINDLLKLAKNSDPTDLIRWFTWTGMVDPAIPLHWEVKFGNEFASIVHSVSYMKVVKTDPK